MPRYYCDYCDTYLTHDSPSVRKQHNAGYKHKANVRSYYQQYEAQLNQSLIDQKVKEHLGAFRPVGPPVGVAYNLLRPGVAILSTPQLPIPGSMTLPPGDPLVQAIRAPVLPRPPAGAPGYMSTPTMPMMMPPPNAPLPGQPTDFQRPVTAPPSIPVPPSSGGPPTLFNPVYQGAAPTSVSSETSNTSAPAPVASH